MVSVHVWSKFSVQCRPRRKVKSKHVLGHFAQTQCLKKVIACNYVQGQKVRGLSSEIVVL